MTEIFLLLAKQVDFLLSGYRHPTTDKVLAGGKVWTFLDNTSTMSALYTDKEQGGTATNPVILDSSGKAEVYGNNIYKMVIYDSNDNLVETINGAEYISIFEPGISGIGSIAELRAASGTPAEGQVVKLLGYYTPGDGGGGPDRFYKSGEAPGTYVDNGGSIIVPTGGDGSSAWLWTYTGSINVRWFGAVGAGSIDDDQPIQAAIDYLMLSGGELFIPQGIYNLSNTLLIDRSGLIGAPNTNRQRVNVTGEGKGNTTLNITTNGIPAMRYIGDPAATSGSHGYATIRDLAFTSDSPTPQKADGLQLTDIAYMSVLECTFHNVNACIVLEGCLSSVFSGLTFNECNNGVVALKGTFSGPHANIFTGCEFRFCAIAGFNGFNSLAQCVFIGCQIEGNGTMGDIATGGMLFRIDGSAGEVGPSFYGCYFEINRGGFDIKISETSTTGRVISMSMSSCNMQRVSGTNYVEHNIITEGDILLNLFGNSFTSFNDYVPDVNRSYLRLSSATRLVDSANRFEDLIETPRTPQSIPYAGKVSGSLGAGVTGILPAGWGVSQIGTGVFAVNHNLGTDNYVATALTNTGTLIRVARCVLYANSAQFVLQDGAPSNADADFTFSIQKI